MSKTRAMKMSNLYAPTLKEDPAEAELASHRLMLRAGMIRKQAAGLYSYLPLAWRSLRKIEDIVRDEMDAAGAQELLMPIMVDAQVWRESGRYNVYGPELMRISDRHEREFVLGPTHEETVTDLIKNELKSYKQLPGEPVPDSGQVPRRDAPPLWPHAWSRVHHEGWLLLQRHAGVPAGDL